MGLILRDADGDEVRNRDVITDFRGQAWRFRYITNGAIDSGKLIVEPVSGGLSREFFPSVFPKLTVEKT